VESLLFGLAKVVSQFSAQFENSYSFLSDFICTFIWQHVNGLNITHDVLSQQHEGRNTEVQTFQQA
jgi:hypothetical protein